MISKELCSKVLEKAVSTGADYAEIYCENTLFHQINMISDQVDSITDQTIAGVGIRVYKGLRSVSASTVDTSEKGLIDCAEKAAEALSQGTAEISINLKERIFGDIHPIKIVPSSVSNFEKIKILKDGYFAAKNYDSSIRQVTGTFLDVDHNIQIANTDGIFASDRQIRTRLSISAVAEKNGEMQTGGCNPGRRMGLEMFETISPEETGISAARQAVVMAGAKYCPAGQMTVAVGNGFGGVIFHEACGHSLEATSVALGRSQFCGKLGQRVACEKFTAIDDGTIPNAWGSINIDDEGTPSKRNVLIENGILKSYLIDKFNGRRMGMPSTGSSRRQSYLYTPTSRMTNTFIAPGPDKNEDIIASIDNGLYAKEMGGGSVNPVTGEFNFAVREGYLVRNGQICEPVRGASLVGKGSDTIAAIDMIGSDLKLAEGMCGSASGSIPTCVGEPMIRVSKITVGGR